MEKAAKEGRKRLREGESELEEARNKVQLLETGMAWLKSKVTKTEKVVIDGILRSETLEELKGYTEINFGGDDLPVEYFCTDTPLPASIVKAVLSKKEPAKWLRYVSLFCRLYFPLTTPLSTANSRSVASSLPRPSLTTPDRHASISLPSRSLLS